MRNSYQFTSEAGDYVLLPNGEVGLVTKTEIHVGHFKEVTAFPLAISGIRKFFWFFFGWCRFYDKDINRLWKIGSVKN